MRSAKQMKVEQLASALGRLSPKEFKSLVEILDKRNVQARRRRAHQEVAEGKVVSEHKLFKDLS